MEPYITSITLKALMIVCDWGGTFPIWKCWVLYTVQIHVPCNSKQEQGTGYTEKYLQEFFLTMPFVHATRLGNRTYQICYSMNYFQLNDQNVLLFTLYKNRKWLSQRQIWQISWRVKKYWKMTISAFLVIICGWISWPQGQGLFLINLTKISVERS